LADAVRAALRLVPDSLGAFLSPVRERLLEEVGSALTPFEPDAGRRRQMAQETTAARKLHVVASCPWHIFAVQESPVGTARTVLKDVAAILDGATPWKSA